MDTQWVKRSSLFKQELAPNLCPTTNFAIWRGDAIRKLSLDENCSEFTSRGSGAQNDLDLVWR
jgi:hypothetical protein